MKEASKQRNLIIYMLKGFAVLSVLLGHALQRGLGIPGANYLNNFLFQMIYTYHMPLFMLLSGYCLANYTRSYDFKFLSKKIKRLIVPTVVWSYLIWLVNEYEFVGIKEFIPFPSSIISYTIILMLHPTYVIWFLYVIFIFSVWFMIQNNINRNNDKYISIILSILFYLILNLLNSEYYGIYELKLYFPIFAFGYYLDSSYLYLANIL